VREPPPSTDPYVVLGLERGAPMPEVKRAYRRLAKAYHPDSAGEAELARFLAIHEAYESIRAGRPMARTRGAASAASKAAAPEPWRADPERARAARERARRGTGTGSRTGSPGGGTAGAPGSSSSRRTGTSGGTRGPGRRNVRKATLGSTSYDEARDPNDATWSGASWYGPSTGEYWIINPREYADPRKHGPEYQSRARQRVEATEPAGATGATAGIADDTTGTGAVGTAAPPSGSADEAPWTFQDQGPTAAGGSMPRADRQRRAAWAAPDEDRATAGDGATPTWGSSWPDDAREIRRTRPPRSAGGSPREWLGASVDDPLRRLGLALVAWPPIGLAAATMIGDVTGCNVYSADCGGTEPLLPWLAQAGILGLLLLLPPAARVLAGGSIAILIALVPITAFLVAVGASGAPQAGFALTFFLVGAWLAGVGWGALQLVRQGRASRALP
jgi:hypothetical protein